MTEILTTPDWTLVERYDVNASAGRDVSRDDLRAMVRTLLAERFQFIAHVETRERPTYALALARDDGQLGPGIRRTATDCDSLAAAAKRSESMPAARNGAPLCGLVEAGGTLKSGGLTMRSLASLLRSPAGRVVVDKTGLEGVYEFSLRYNPDPMSDVDSDAPSLFAALREQLGLKLEPQSDPLRVLVVDHVERPAPN